ncbi:DUF2304 domain-containing protein [Candidatus Woesearchaeota archaeon]|nr:DUF2304 domain-containing protein [Candidatus Woesearchaeota archaeon]
MGIQIAGFIFGLFMLYYSFLNYKKKEFTEKEFVFWILIWLLIITVTLFPFVLDPILKPLGFFRALDFLVISGFLLIILMIFYTYSLTKKTQKQVEALVRVLALKKNKRK